MQRLLLVGRRRRRRRLCRGGRLLYMMGEICGGAQLVAVGSYGATRDLETCFEGQIGYVLLQQEDARVHTHRARFLQPQA